jgi:CrcB protein
VVSVLLVLLCGGVGAVARFVVDTLVQSRRLSEFPLGTLVVNTIGCFLLGALVGLQAPHRAATVLGTALIGSYTTFSTWMIETHRPAQDGDSGVAWANLVVSLIAGLAAVALGRKFGAVL